MKKLFCYLILIPLSALAADPGVVIHSQSYVSSPQISLGDIAEFQNLTSIQRKLLSQLQLGDAPAFGEKRVFSSQGLAEVLRSKIKQFVKRDATFSRVKMQIPNKIIIENRGRIISQKEVLTKLRDLVQESCADCDIKITDFRMPVLKNISPDAAWDFHDDVRRVKGSFQVGIEVKDQQQKDLYWVTGRATFYKSVPIASHTLNLGDRLRADDYSFVIRDVTFAPDASPTENELKGAQLKTTLSANQIIYKNSLVRQPALSRGQLVMVTTGEGSWQVSTRGIAQDNGYIGDLVKVMNPDTKKTIVGKVVADGMVEVKQ